MGQMLGSLNLRGYWKFAPVVRMEYLVGFFNCTAIRENADDRQIK